MSRWGDSSSGVGIQLALKKKILIFAIVALSCMISRCARVSGVRDEPLTAGISQTYDSAFGNVLKAAREAVLESGLKIEDASKINETTWMIVGKAGLSAFSWGAIVRVIVQEASSNQTVVRVLTKKKMAANVTTPTDYSRSILGNIALKLK